MSNEHPQVDRPTPSAAAAALDELAAARRAVSAAERRTLPFVLGARSFLTLVRHATADHVTDRRTRRFVTGTCLALDALLLVGDNRSTAVQPAEVSPDEHRSPPPALYAVGVLAAVAVDRSVVAVLRRTRLRRPNTAAGLVLAIEGTLADLVVRRLLSGPGPDA